MRKIVACAAVLAGLTATAYAEDLSVDSIKDPLPDTLSSHGVTFYGTIDVGYAYQTNGRPLGYIVSNLEYMPFGLVTRNLTGQSISTVTANALEQSKIGVSIEENIGYGFQAIGRLDTGFDPMSGELSNGCKSVLLNSGIPYAQQSSNSDSARCGQAFDNVAYGGLSSPLYGTLTVGRQFSLQLDTLAAYDPMALSYAFSVLGFSGAAAGMGSTEASRWDNSVKYVFTYGPFHAAGMYTNGGEDTGIFGDAYGANVGFTYRGFSLDGVWEQEHGVVNLKSAANNALLSPTLAAAISDNTGWTIAGKYTYEFGRDVFDGGLKDGGSCGGLKDAACPAPAKLTFFAGYTHTDQSNPRDQVLAGNSQGGYPLTYPIDNNNFTTDRIYQFFWTGAKYELPSGWSFTAAYYHIDQNSYVSDNEVCTGGGASATECAGSFDQGALLADYAFNKHLDVYAGVTYAIANNGLAAGYQGNPAVRSSCGASGTAPCGVSGTGTSVDVFDFVTGVRLKF